MQNNPEGLTHRQVVHYITGKASNPENDLIRRVRKKYPAWSLFFEMLEKTVSRTHLHARVPKHSSGTVIPTFDETGRLFEGVFSGTLGKPEAQKWLDALLASPAFFSRWMGIVSEVEPDHVMESVAGMPAIRMQSDGVLLARLQDVSGCGVPAAPRGAGTRQQAGSAWQRALESIEGLSRSLKWGFALSTAVLVLSVVVMGSRQWHAAGGKGAYVFDDIVPYEYETEAFRSAEPDECVHPDVRTWTVTIQLGIADYLLFEYDDALAGFREAGNLRPGLSGKADAGVLTQWEMESAFYGGLSHLALWRTRRGRPSDAVRMRHAAEALRFLFRADSIAASGGLQNEGREAYFIGMVYSLQGRRDEAWSWLSQISPGSPFFEKSVALSRNGEDKKP